MICRVYIYIYTNLNYKKFYEIGISLEYNVCGRPFFGPPLPPKRLMLYGEAQTARMAMSISETLQRLQATKASNRSGGATGSKGPKTADLEVRHYVPLGENSGVFLLEWHPSHDFFPFGCAFFFLRGGVRFEWMVMTQNMEHTFRWLPGRFRPIPFRMASFTSDLRCIRSLVMSWMRRWNMWWPWFRLTFPYERWDMMVMLQEGFLWVTWVTWVFEA